MEVLILLAVFSYACKKAWEETSGSARQSRAAHMSASGASSGGRPRRAASAIQHDAGFWAHQASHGFPAARHGFASGWHDGQQAASVARTGRAKSRADHAETRARHVPEYRAHVQRYRDAMAQIRGQDEPDNAVPRPNVTAEPASNVKPASPGPTHLLTARSRNGQPVNRITGAPEDTVAVYGDEDLRRRLAAAKDRPDLDVTARPLNGNGVLHHTSPDNGLTPADGKPGEPEKETPEAKEGTGMATSTAEVTYAQHHDILTQVRDECEQEVASKRRERIANLVDSLSGLGLDKDSLSEAAAIDDELRAEEEAAKRALEAANTASVNLEKRHGGIQEAVDSSPVDKPAEPAYYDKSAR